MAAASAFMPSLASLKEIRSPLPPPKSYIAVRPRDGRPHRRAVDFRLRRRLTGGDVPLEMLPDGEDPSFDAAVRLFNGGDYHRCHDVLEELWYGAEEPTRTLLHGILQCAVGFHHLFNQNHRGAMMELGEGLCKIKKMGFNRGPFLRFEEEVSAALEFVYQTQKELAACTDELCLAMDGSERSYQLLGSFAAGQQLYSLDVNRYGNPHIIFLAANSYSSSNPLRVKVPTLDVTGEHLKEVEYKL
ncbi:uncharacterized protein [Typha latifolia]|uniref:uncharacterized protein n=1 Tax=Typha latifolia TaxID=4733 RepID=UPI003C2FD6EF